MLVYDAHTIVLFTVCVCIKTSIHGFNRPSIIRTGPLYSQCRKMIDPAAVYLFEKENEREKNRATKRELFV